MRTKSLNIFIGILVALMVMLGATMAFSHSADTANAERQIVPVDSNNAINMSIDSNGILSWDEVTSATGYNVSLSLRDGSQVNSWNTNNTFLPLVTNMDSEKYDSNEYIVEVRPQGVSGAHSFTYYYTSDVEQLEAPQHLTWNGGTAEWEAVDGAVGYYVQLFGLEGSVSGKLYTTNVSYDLSGFSPEDGWTFRVQAATNGTSSDKRNSIYVESPAKGSRVGYVTPVAPSNSFNMYIADGLLWWDEVTGATGYDVVLAKPNGYELETWSTTNRFANVLANMNNSKYDSGSYRIILKPQGVSVNSDFVQCYYTSNVDKLESPNDLRWNGSIAEWDDVQGAIGFTIALYDFNGRVTSVNVGTSVTYYDFSGNNPNGGWTFRVQAYSNGTLNDLRNSSYTESPKKVKELDPGSVSVDGGKAFSTVNPYFKNGASDVTSDSSNYNAYYNKSTCTLTLNNYVGDSIAIGGPQDVDINIVLVGTNVINTSSQKALSNINGGNIRITATADASLNINQTLSNMSTIYGISTQTTAGGKGDIIIDGYANVKVDLVGTNEQQVFGVYAAEDVKVEGYGALRVKCTSNLTYSGTTAGFAIYAGNNFVVDTTGNIVADMSDVESENGNYGIYAANGNVLTAVGQMTIITINGSYCCPLYPAYSGEDFDCSDLTEGNVRTTIYTKKAPAGYTVNLWPNGGLNEGTSLPITIEGQTGNYVLPECTFTAPEGKEFSHWAIGSVLGEEKVPGAAYTLSGDLNVYAVWKEKTFTLSPVDGNVAVDADYEFTYSLSIQPDQVYLSFYNDYQELWFDNFAIVDKPTSIGAVTTGKVSHTVGYEGSRLYRLVAIVGVQKYYSDNFTVTWSNVGFTKQPQDVTVPLNMPSIVKFAIDGTATTLNLQYEVSAGVWEHAMGISEDNYVVIEGREEEFVRNYRIFAVIGGNDYYSDPFTVTWSNGAKYEFTTAPVGETLRTGYSYNVSWALNTSVTKYVIVIKDGEEWVEIGSYEYMFLPNAGDVEDIDIDEPTEGIGTYTYKVVAYIEETVIAESELFDISWVSYTVSFDANGGDGTMADETEQYGGFILPECGFTAPTDKVFKAWSTTNDHYGTWYLPGEEYEVEGNVTFYAIWEEYTLVNTYTSLVNAVNLRNSYIKLTDNITHAIYNQDIIYQHRLIFDENRKTVLDLNGYTLNVTNYNEYMANEISWIVVYEQHELTIKNGSLIYSNENANTDQSAYGAIFVEDNATLITEDVNIRNKKNGSAVRAHDNATVILNGGEIYTLSGWAVFTMHTSSLTLDGGVQLHIENPGSASSSLAGGLNAKSEGSLTLNNAAIKDGMLIHKDNKVSIDTHVIYIGNARHTKALNVYDGDVTANAADDVYYWKETASNYLYLDNASENGDTPIGSVTFYSKSKKYEIVVNDGSASAGGNPTNSGYYTEEITITADEIEGKIFKEWSVEVEDGMGIILDDYNSATTTFIMTSAKVTITAIYKNAPISYLEITFNTPVIGETLPREATTNNVNVPINTQANDNPNWDIQWNIITSGNPSDPGEILNSNIAFLPGVMYRALLRLEITNPEYSLSDSLMVSVNGSTLDVNVNVVTDFVAVVNVVYTMPMSDFNVTYTEDTRLGLGGTVTVDTEALANNYSVIFDGTEEVEYNWYIDGEYAYSSSNNSYAIKSSDAGKKISLLVVASKDGNDYYGFVEEQIIDNKLMVINIIVPDIDADCYVNTNPIHSGIKVADTHAEYGAIKMTTWYDSTYAAKEEDVEYYAVNEEGYVFIIFQYVEGITIHSEIRISINGGELLMNDASSPAQRTISIFYGFVAVEHEHKYDEGLIYNAYDEDYHWKECIVTHCVNKEDSATEYGSHYAIGATCVTAGTCICGKTNIYGEHDFENGTYVKVDEEYHVGKCANCDETNSDYNVHEGGEATCYSYAVCTLCQEEYGNKLDHDFSDDWTYKAADGHAHVCENVGCTDNDGIVPHTPNIESATEDQAKVCTVCQYVIEPALNHNHVLTLVPAESATCTEDGNIAYYTCECGQWFSDENGNNVIENHTSVVIPATDHNYDGVQWTITEDEHYKVCKNDNCEVKQGQGAHEGGTSDCQNKKVCTVCGGEYGTYGDHVFGNTWDHKELDGHAYVCTVVGCTEHDVLVPHTPNIPNATEDQAQVCEDCGYVMAPALNHVHSLTLVPEVKATCTESGNIAYYTCECGQWFFDENANNLISNHSSVITQAINHNYDGVEWTKTEDGHYKECKNDNCTVKSQEGAHADVNTDNVCDVCGYVMATDEPGNEPGDEPGNEPGDQPGTEPEQPGEGGNEGGNGDGGNAGGNEGNENQGGNQGGTEGEIEEPTTLSAGAIAGIAVGATVGALALGVGIFLIIWIFVKKKSIADLLAIFKKK